MTSVTEGTPQRVTGASASGGYKQARGSHTRARAGRDVLGRKSGDVVAVKDRIPIVTDWSGMMDWHHAPPSYEVWAKQYYGYTKYFLAKYIPAQDIDDVAQVLMSRFAERDSIGVFTRTWPTRSKTGKSVFRTYYMHFLLAYAPGKLRNLMKSKSRELVIMDAPLDSETGTTFGEVHGDATTIDTSVEFDLLVDSIRQRATDAQRDVVDQLLGMAIGAGQNPALTRAGISREMGISQDRAGVLLDHFRQLVSDVVGSRVTSG